MESKKYWFAQKRYGYGAGLPIAWQGWAVLAAYVLAIGVATLLVERHSLAAIGTLIPATLVLLIVCAKTTRGGWRWRWGNGA